MIALNYLGAIICWSLVVIIIGIIVFRIAVNRHKNQVKSVSFAIMTVFLVFFGVPGLVRGIQYLHRGSWGTFAKEDIPGTWTTSYDDYGCWHFTGTEILKINGDFTYDQLFIDTEGYRQHLVQNDWYFVDQTVFLIAAKRLPYYFNENECNQIDVSPSDSLVGLPESELKLHVWSSLFANDGIMLETKPAGDPDTPAYTRYFKSK